MPTLTVQLASGQEVLSDFFLDVDSTLSTLADAAGAQLALASSRCVLLSPSGECVAHSLTASATSLADGDVITVLVMPPTGIRVPKRLGLRRSEARRLCRHVGAVSFWRQLRRREVQVERRCFRLGWRLPSGEGKLPALDLWDFDV